MQPSLLLSLLLGYLPPLLLLSLARAWYGLPVWLVVAGVLVGGALLTLAIATLRSTPELWARRGWRSGEEAGGQDPADPAENGGNRQ